MRPALRRLILSSALVAATAFAAAAQDSAPVTLVADQVSLNGTSQLVARGGVEVIHEGAVLRASEVRYDRATGGLEILGPITLTEPGGTVVLASAAELSADLRNGLLQSARVVMDRQLQLAASEMQRVEGRHTVLSRAVASSCQICADDPTPLWEIRAQRIIHDELERQIYFDNAQLRMFGVPVAWLPHFRMPDPTLDRARGVLAPRLISTSRLGFGLEVPYFIPLGPSRDLTLLPLLATKDVQSMGLRYRQAFNTGNIEISGALSRDQSMSQGRGWLGVTGSFALPRGFGLYFTSRMVTDDAYLRDYDLSEDDRLDSLVQVNRIRRDELIEARLRHSHSIRDGESNSRLPQLIADLEWMRRFDAPGIGGRLTFGINIHGHRRSSDEDIFGLDMSQARFTALWRRDWLLGRGILAAAEIGTAVDLTRIGQDSRYNSRVYTSTPMLRTELRWPWARMGATGISDVIEPVVEFVWSRQNNADQIPNSDSGLVEFDEGNLFGFSRFPGYDRREGGRRINAGLSWTRIYPGGTSLIASAGRVFRFSDYNQFSPVSGLNGRRSSWVSALHLQTASGMRFQGRATFDDSFDLSRGELRMGISRERYGLDAAWIWADADPSENRPVDTSEWSVDGRVKLASNWTAMASGRYDFGVNEPTRAGLGLEYLNECLKVQMALTRKFSGTAAIRPSTNFSLSMDLLGFGGRPSGSAAARSCSF